MKQSPRSLDCWDCGFESRWGHGCLLCLFFFCISCGPCDGLINRSEDLYQLCVCVHVRACVSDFVIYKPQQ